VVRVTKVPVVSQIAAVYVSAFRGTPLLVQIFVLYYGLPSVGIEFTPVTAGILALTLNVAAYLSESMRGAILGIDKGQWEAGLSVGLTWGQTLWNKHRFWATTAEGKLDTLIFEAGLGVLASKCGRERESVCVCVCVCVHVKIILSFRFR